MLRDKHALRRKILNAETLEKDYAVHLSVRWLDLTAQD